MPETKVGVVTHYFSKVGVAMIMATDGPVSVGDKIRIKGHTTNHTQVIESLQFERKPVPGIEVGQEAGVKVGCHAHERDEVFKVTD